jgi:hypothetical protein
MKSGVSYRGECFLLTACWDFRPGERLARLIRGAPRIGERYLSKFMRSRMQPLIAIFGTTGVGKSKLGIELALALAQSEQNGWKGARIINADAMQVYDGMDILTNKAPMAERRGVEHLLMSFKKPWEQYVVGQWVQDAIAKARHYFLLLAKLQRTSLCRSRKPTREIKFPSSLAGQRTGCNTSYSRGD